MILTVARSALTRLENMIMDERACHPVARILSERLAHENAKVDDSREKLHLHDKSGFVGGGKDGA